MLIVAGGGGGGADVTEPKLLGQGGYGGGNVNANGGIGGNGGGGRGTSAGGGGTGTGNTTNGGSGSIDGLTLGGGGGGYGASGGGGYGGGGGGGGSASNFSGGGGGSSFVNSSLGSSSLFSYVALTTLNSGTYGAGGEAATSPQESPGSDGNSGYVSISWETPPTPTPTPTPTPPPTPTPTPTPPEPISNICFPAGTLIQTDQGLVAIEKIDTDIHTIRQQPILYITRTTTLDLFLVCFQKDALGLNCPSSDTVMTKDHNVLFKGKMVPAYKFLTHYKQVKKVKYSGELLYNVLLRNYSSMLVNNLMCETLHPQNFIAKLYTTCYTDEYNDNIIDIMNFSIKNKDYTKYKRILEQAKYI